MQKELQRAANHLSGRKFRSAENIVRKILRNDPGNAQAQNSLGLILLNQGNAEKALRFFAASVNLEPNNARYLYDFGNGLKAQNQFSQAIEAYEKALGITDTVAEIHNNLGTALLETGQMDRAAASFNRAIELHPGLFQPHLNIGNIYREGKAFAEAIKFYRRAIEINPVSAEAYNNLGHTLLGLSKSSEAIECFEKALEISPDLYEANANLKYQQELICDWRDFDTRNALLENCTRAAIAAGKKPPVTPFQQLARSDDLNLNFLVAQAWSQACAVKMSNFKLRRRTKSRRQENAKIRLGYFSHDFHDHPVGHLMAQLFANHDRERFEVVAFSNGAADRSVYRQRIVDNCDAFIDLRGESDFDAAQRIYDEGIDILVDLAGYTEGYRMEIFAVKPAPVQVSYLGYPGTTGARFMDYIIADKIICPVEHSAHYSEKFVYLPTSYIFCPRDGMALDQSVTRKELGLKEDQIVFCSFNGPYKIEPVMFRVWMAILRDVENSVIWIADGGSRVNENLRREAKELGISEDRIVFAARCPDIAGHLSRLQLADIALDTRICNGHVTTIDALYAGVPVITAPNNHYQSRSAASILRAAGVPELIASDIDDYFSLAVALARDPAALKKMRGVIVENKRNQPLFDSKRHTKGIEAAFTMIWDRVLGGEAPAQIHVPAKF